jgi:hypothetical protein
MPPKMTEHLLKDRWRTYFACGPDPLSGLDEISNRSKSKQILAAHPSGLCTPSAPAWTSIAR